MALPELQDGAQSKQKAAYVSHTVSKRGESDYIELTYKRLDGQNPGVEAKAGNFVTALDEASRDLIKAKGEFVVVKTKKGKFWPLTKVESIETYVAKTGNKGSYNASNHSAGKPVTSFNNAGIKVGAVLHDAVALAGTGASVTKVKTIAEELLTLSYELEDNVNKGKYEPKTEKAKIDIVKEPIVEDIELDNIDF